MRVIVTGERSDGTTVKVSDRALSDLSVTTSFGARFADVFGSDGLFDFPSTGLESHSVRPLFPGPGGFRFWIFTVPAHCAPLQPGPTTDDELDALRSVAPDRAEHLASLLDGMAYADTVEWIVVLSGTVEHLLPDGQCFLLAAGDSIVQIGARHRWRNDGDVPCVMAVAAIGGCRAGTVA